MSVERQLIEDGFEDRTFLLGSCLYVLLLDETVQYVGRTTDVLARLIKHRRQGRIAFNGVWLKACSRSYASAEEVRLIKLFTTPLNVAGAMRVRRSTRAEIKAAANELMVGRISTGANYWWSCVA